MGFILKKKKISLKIRDCVHQRRFAHFLLLFYFGRLSNTKPLHTGHSALVARVNGYTSSVISWDSVSLDFVTKKLNSRLVGDSWDIGTVLPSIASSVIGSIESAVRKVEKEGDLGDGEFLLTITDKDMQVVKGGVGVVTPKLGVHLSRPKSTEHGGIGKWGAQQYPHTFQIFTPLVAFKPAGRNVLDVDVVEAESAFYTKE